MINKVVLTVNAPKAKNKNVYPLIMKSAYLAKDGWRNPTDLGVK